MMLQMHHSNLVFYFVLQLLCVLLIEIESIKIHLFLWMMVLDVLKFPYNHPLAPVLKIIWSGRCVWFIFLKLTITPRIISYNLEPLSSPITCWFSGVKLCVRITTQHRGEVWKYSCGVVCFPGHYKR
jgi:hypothetical protein